MSLFYANPDDQPENSHRDPRTETFIYALKVNFCSTLKWKSFVVVFLLILLVLFIIQRIIDGIYLEGELLQVKPDGTYTSFMSIKFESLSKGEIWRLFTGLLGFIHMQQFVSILIFSLFFVTMVESVQGLKKCIGNSINYSHWNSWRHFRHSVWNSLYQITSIHWP